MEALEAALRRSRPEIFNTDQGAQFTSVRFVSILEDREIDVSMDGRGRAMDNIFVERLWRSLKYEEVYLNDYRSGQDAYRGLSRYFEFYNSERFHQSLNYRTPAEMYDFDRSGRRRLDLSAKTTTKIHLNYAQNLS